MHCRQTHPELDTIQSVLRVHSTIRHARPFTNGSQIGILFVTFADKMHLHASAARAFLLHDLMTGIRAARTRTKSRWLTSAHENVLSAVSGNFSHTFHSLAHLSRRARSLAIARRTNQMINNNLSQANFSDMPWRAHIMMNE